MEIRDMQFDEVEQRSAEVLAEMEKEGADLDALKAEAQQLQERKAELRKQAAERKASLPGGGPDRKCCRPGTPGSGHPPP